MTWSLEGFEFHGKEIHVLHREEKMTLRTNYPLSKKKTLLGILRGGKLNLEAQQSSRIIPSPRNFPGVLFLTSKHKKPPRVNQNLEVFSKSAHSQLLALCTSRFFCNFEISFSSRKILRGQNLEINLKVWNSTSRYSTSLRAFLIFLEVSSYNSDKKIYN